MRTRLDNLPDDWVADWLQERGVMSLQPDGSNVLRRVQVIQARKDSAEYYEVTDLGAAEDFQHEPLFIWGAGVTGVGRMRERADHWRTEKTLADRYGLEVPNLYELHLQATEERWKTSRHESVFGPAVTRQRG